MIETIPRKRIRCCAMMLASVLTVTACRTPPPAPGAAGPRFDFDDVSAEALERGAILVVAWKLAHMQATEIRTRQGIVETIDRKFAGGPLTAQRYEIAQDVRDATGQTRRERVATTDQFLGLCRALPDAVASFNAASLARRPHEESICLSPTSGTRGESLRLRLVARLRRDGPDGAAVEVRYRIAAQ